MLIGSDIGGSHISVAQVSWNGNKAHISAFHESDVDTSISAAEIISNWAELIRKSAGDQTDFELGIAMPGPYDYPNGISLIKEQGKMKSLDGLSVKNLLADSLKINPQHISFTNDAEAFLLGECLAGAGRGFTKSMGLTLGTGLGSALQTDGEVNDAKLWTAPFRDGIAEDYLGTAWIKQIAVEKLGNNIKGMKELLSGGFDDLIVADILSQFGLALGEFLAQYAVPHQCEGVVLGGKMSKSAYRYLPCTETFLESLGHPLEIRISELGEQAAMIGACLPFILKHKSITL